MKSRTITGITLLSGVLSAIGCRGRAENVNSKPLPKAGQEHYIGSVPQVVLDQTPIAFEKLSDHQIIKSIKSFQGKPEKLGNLLAEYIALVEQNIPELQYDQVGWHGNDLVGFVDRNLMFQSNCDGEAGIVLKMLYTLQREGFLFEYDFHYEYLMNHTAVGVSKWNNGGRLSDTIFIIDPWLSEPGEPPKLFFGGILNNANHVWRRAIEEFKKEQDDERDKFSGRFKYKNILEIPALFDYDLWNKVNDKLHWDYLVPLVDSDFVFLKYFASPDSNLRFAIKKDYFDLMRDKMICCLEAEGKLSKEEKKQLQDLTLENKTSEEETEIWKTFQSYIELYFKIMYPGSSAVKDKFGE